MTIKNKNTTVSIDLESRVGRLEGTVEQIKVDIQENSRTLESLAETITVFKDSMMSQIGRATAPKWPLIMGIATLIITIITLIGGGFTIVMGGHSDAIKQVQSDIDTLAKEKLINAYEHGATEANRKSFEDHRKKDEEELKDIRSRQIEVLRIISAQAARIENLEHQLDITDARRYNERMEKYRSPYSGQNNETKTLEVDKLPIR